MRGAIKTTEHPEMERIAAIEGEDPMRILSRSKETILARIRGIERTSLLRAYQAAERRYFDGGRDAVLEAIDDRLDELDGDRQ